jgi:hypothetical protein
MFGIVRMSAVSSRAIWEWPSGPMPTPTWVPTIRTFVRL